MASRRFEPSLPTARRLLGKQRAMSDERLTYNEIYRNLEGLVALQVAMSTPLRRLKDEKDTAFVKRIVATYIEAAQPRA